MNNKTKQFVSFIQTVSNLNEIPHKYALQTYFITVNMFNNNNNNNNSNNNNNNNNNDNNNNNNNNNNIEFM